MSTHGVRWQPTGGCLCRYGFNRIRRDLNQPTNSTASAGAPTRQKALSARPQPELARTADLVLRKTRIAVFVDGCYWHGCPDHHTQPATNSQYWANKIARNVERDNETTAYLQQAGWTVLRFWEHEDPEAVADQVQEAVQSALAGRRGGCQRTDVSLQL